MIAPVYRGLPHPGLLREIFFEFYASRAWTIERAVLHAFLEF